MSAPPTASGTSAPAANTAGAAPMLCARNNRRVQPQRTPVQDDLDPLAVHPDELPAAAAFLADMLYIGCAFELLGDRDLVWFGPLGARTPERRCAALYWKPELIALLGEGPRSRRTWGNPSPHDWPRVENSDESER
jgi:hypothetical protein